MAILKFMAINAYPLKYLKSCFVKLLVALTYFLQVLQHISKTFLFVLNTAYTKKFKTTIKRIKFSENSTGSKDCVKVWGCQWITGDITKYKTRLGKGQCENCKKTENKAN